MSQDLFAKTFNNSFQTTLIKSALWGGALSALLQVPLLAFTLPLVAGGAVGFPLGLLSHRIGEARKRRKREQEELLELEKMLVTLYEEEAQEETKKEEEEKDVKKLLW